MPSKIFVHENRIPQPGNAIPVSTYRLQLSNEFTFDDAKAQIPYLAKLGISHLYLSPILQAVPASTHGYDVIDHSRISEDLGGLEKFKELTLVAKEHKIGIVLDIVPNHMALPTPAYFNHQLWDVLHKGSNSSLAHWFDIEWGSEDNKIVLPILRTRSGQVMEQGEFTVEQFKVPTAFSDPNTESEEISVLKYQDYILPLAKGTEDLPIDELLEAQNYRLSYWLAGDEELNYRRFFDIGTLFALKMDDDDVFEKTHRLIIDLVEEGLVDGLRIDHIDGLANPKKYLDKLYEATGGVWIIVEKILHTRENLEHDWKCAGTTGYDSANIIQHAMINQYGYSRLRSISNQANENMKSLLSLDSMLESTDLANVNLNNLSQLIEASKRQIVRTSLYADVHRITNMADRIIRDDRFLRDHTWRSINNCIVEMLVLFGAYRPYVIQSVTPSRQTLDAVYAAKERASHRLSADKLPTLDIICDLILGKSVGDMEHADIKLRKSFSTTFSQVCSAVMAKGVEDTAYYRYTDLTSLAEVGGNIQEFSISQHAFHNFATNIQNNSPYTMTLGTSHDTKRSEDVRAGLSILSQNTEVWQELLASLTHLTSRYHSPLIDPIMENLLWQTIIGTWTPDSENAGPISINRLQTYLTKTMREAKTFTTWHHVNSDYEEAIMDFAASVLSDYKVIETIQNWMNEQILQSQSAILAHKAIQLTMPGVADVYQGTEWLNLSLVDPDNRRPVNFDALKCGFEKIVNPSYDMSKPPGDLSNHCINYDSNLQTISERKFLVTYAALQLRKDYLGAFVGPNSGYESLPITTDCALGFIRTESKIPKVITLVSRYSGTLQREAGYGKHSVILPDLPSGFNRWVDRLTGKTYKKGATRLVDIFEKYPVAFFEPVQGGDMKEYLKLWSPNAKKVEAFIANPKTYADDQLASEALERAEFSKVKMLRLSDLKDSITADEEGWWRSQKPVKVGHDYMFRIDGGEMVPDPCSERQVFGVEGFSRLAALEYFKFTDFAWTGIDPLGKSFYELHIGTFTPDGTLEAAIEKLPELKKLGVEIIELMPVATFDGSFGWGYDGADIYAVHESYGGPQKLQKFVNAAHNLGLGVCVDVVYNHLGPTGDYLNDIAPYYTNAHITPWGKGFNFDQEYNQGVRKWIIDHAIRLFEVFHVDCLRLDAIHEIHDDSKVHILSELSSQIETLSLNTGRQMALIAESDSNDYRTLDALDNGGYQMDMQWADDFHHALYAYLSNESGGYYEDFGSLDILAKALKQGWVYDEQFSKFRNRIHGTKLPDDFDLRRFVVCFSNHDQIGNRGMGDRPNFRLNEHKLYAAAALTILSPFTPLIFQGEEWAASSPFQFFADYQLDDVSNNCRIGRAKEFEAFGWQDFYGEDSQIPDPVSYETFYRSKLNWGEIGQQYHHDLLKWYQDLLKIRSDNIGNDPITSEDIGVTVSNDETGDTIVVEHSGIGVVVNLSTTLRTIDGFKGGTVIKTTDSRNHFTMSGALKVEPHSVSIIKVQ